MTAHQAPDHALNTGELASLAVDANCLARLLCLSVRSVRTLDAMGRLPQPLALGLRAKRWSVREIQDWLDAGAPDRAMWEVLKRNGRPAR